MGDSVCKLRILLTIAQKTVTMVNRPITLKQIYLIVYHIGFHMSHYLPNLDKIDCTIN